MLDFFPKTTAGDIFRKFMVYFLVGLVAVLMAFWMMTRMENKRVSLILANQENSRLRLVQNVIGQRLTMLAVDVMILAESEYLKKYLLSSSPSSLNDVADRFRSFAEDKKTYGRIAFFDQSGRELAAIDLPDRAVEDDLEQSVHRDHVAEALTLEKGGIAVALIAETPSPFQVLHLSTPVFDNAGQRRGAIMLDCRTDRVIDTLFDIFPERDGGWFQVVDSNGYLLRLPPPGTDRAPSLAAERPDLWQAMQNRANGQLLTPDGMFTFSRFLPATEIRKTAMGWQENEAAREDWRRTDDNAWYFLLFTPAPELTALRIWRQNPHLLWLIPLGCIALAAGSLHLAINRANKERSDRAVELLSTAIEQSPAAAVITDMNGLIRYANQKFLAMSGYAREEIVGQNPRIFRSGETPAEVYRELWQTIRAGRVWTGEFLNKRKDNTPYIVSAKISPIFRKSGMISGYLAIQEDITETRRLQQQLEHMATIDGLTGTCNRSHFLHLFNQELRREERYGQPLCLLLFDLDHFKAINDTYGHQTGDRVLEEFARIVALTLRDTDIFGRLGGEEFGVVLPQTDYEGARQLAERLRNAVEKMTLACEGSEIRITVSIGGTQWERNDHKVEVLLHRADHALYEAKKRGRNQVCFKLATADKVDN